MSLSQPRYFFGIHSVAFYSRTDGLPYGILKVLKSSSLTITGTPVELTGGSNKYPWAVEDGEQKAEMSLKFSEYPDFVFTLLLGKAPSANAAETTGSVGTASNIKGTSVINASTGISAPSVLSGSDADLKFGRYIIKAVTSTTVDVYACSDIDFGRGTAGSFQTDLLKVTPSPLSITASSATTVTGYGFKLTGGSGTIGLVAGDTASFEVRPDNTGSSTVVIGAAASQVFPEFGALVYAQQSSNKEMAEVDAYRCKASGLPIGFDKGAFSEADVKVKLLYDSAKDGVFGLTYIKGA